MEKKKNRRLIILACVLLLLAAFALSPVFPYVRSLAVMKVYSPYCAKSSIMAEQNIELEIPSGDGWYPFVMTYEADEDFSSYIGRPDTKLTILYNFPAFSLKNGCSRFFDESSAYYNSFYGAYLVRCADGEPFGFSLDMRNPDEKAVSEIAKFDFFTLVLNDFGLTPNEQVFEYSLACEQTDVSFLGYDGWTQISSDLNVNGANHEKRGFTSSYLQYGSPSFPVSSDFAPVKMKSIVYAKYFPEWGTAVFFYVMSPSEDVCENCVQTILSRSILKSRE
ncbi:MAG: hypothetical protein CVU91_12825 [Firmicutes bacterium HGW-Firmicutes-16]|nr:MAG: hypothetical protein CVU91_12825 [Firmicutes bacterium HGW-Firmicutes-16]